MILGFSWLIIFQTQCTSAKFLYWVAIEIILHIATIIAVVVALVQQSSSKNFVVQMETEATETSPVAMKLDLDDTLLLIAQTASDRPL